MTVAEMREIEGRAMAAGVSEGELMLMAGEALGRAVGRQFLRRGLAVGFLGKGHNAGDALVALRVLRDEFGWEVAVRAGYEMGEWAELTRRQLEALGEVDFLERVPVGDGLLLLDGLLGIGAVGGLREPLLGLAGEMNDLRDFYGATTVAVDVPSGVDVDGGEVFEGAVVADRTLMIGAAKRGLLMGEAVNAVGSLGLIAVDGLAGGEGEMDLISPQTMDFGKNRRCFDFHKGMAGRVVILAGSDAFAGAAVLAALGAMRGGAGLVTLHVPGEAFEAVRMRLPLEVMVRRCEDARDLLEGRYDARVVGPGLAGFERGMRDLLDGDEVPTVVDAEGLGFLKAGRACHLLTPHPGEFARLAPGLAGLSREEMVREFVSGTEATLLLKGGRTIVGCRGKGLCVNSTGTPMMSSGGQGDLLAGVLGALLAGGMEVREAAAFGAWLCGRAAEICEEEGGGYVSATDVAGRLGAAMEDWRVGRR